MGRVAAGVRAIKLDKDDEVVAMELVEPKQQLLVVTENGYGKRTPVEDYKQQTRGGKGMLTYDKNKFKKTGALIGAMVVDEDDEVFMINSDGIIIRTRAKEVSVLGRATQGVKIMKVEEGTTIVAMAKALREDDEESSDSGNSNDEDSGKGGKGGKSVKSSKSAKSKKVDDGEQLEIGDQE